jgi:hypothetical protein
MAYVEEEIPEEPITVPTKSLLYTVLDHLSTATTLEGETCIV